MPRVRFFLYKMLLCTVSATCTLCCRWFGLVRLSLVGSGVTGTEILCALSWKYLLLFTKELLSKRVDGDAATQRHMRNLEQFVKRCVPFMSSLNS